MNNKCFITIIIIGSFSINNNDLEFQIIVNFQNLILSNNKKYSSQKKYIYTSDPLLNLKIKINKYHLSIMYLSTKKLSNS